MDMYDRQWNLRACRNIYLRERLFGAAMMEDAAVFRNASVLNIFCGDGGVAMLAIRAGARHVLAIDSIANARLARRVVRKSRMSDCITVIGADMRYLDLGGYRYDVLLCSWMDDMGVFKGQVSDLIVARDRFLRPGGIIYPYMIRIAVGAIEDGEYWSATNKWVNASMGHKYLLKREMLRPVLGHLQPHQIATTFCRIVEFNLYTITLADLNRDIYFTLVAVKDSPIHSFCTAFESMVMRPTGTVCLNYSHFTPDNRHTIFYMNVQLNACAGSVIVGKFRMRFKGKKAPHQKLKWIYEYNGRNGYYIANGHYHIH